MRISKSGIISAAIGVIAFLGGCAVTDVPLKETVWIPVSGSPVQAPATGDGVRAWFSIDRENRLTGNGGVNQIIGSVKTAEDGKLIFNPPATTRMAGPNLPYESAFLKALEETRSYQLSGDTLTLLDQNGKPLAIFKAGSEELKNPEK